MISTSTRTVKGVPCGVCGCDFKRKDTGACAKCNPQQWNTNTDIDAVERRRAVEAHQHRGEYYDGEYDEV